MKEYFQVILLVIFIFGGIFGLLAFSGVIPLGEDTGENGAKGSVVLWGTYSSSAVLPALNDFNNFHTDFNVSYVQKSPETFDRDLLEALASGVGPDMFFMPNDLILSYRNKILSIPYTSIPQAAFRNSFASAGDVFLTGAGILAMPIAIDPLVMYYNRSMLNSKGLINPPVYWDEVAAVVPALTEKDQDNRISRSAVALGQFANVTNAKDILSAMFMQTGNPIVTEKDGVLISTLNTYSNQYNLGSVLEFFTNFTNPSRAEYTWNRSFPNSQTAFSGESVAVYFGFGSELPVLRARNPNQDFLVSSFPQIRGASSKFTGAKVVGIAVSAFSKNLNTAFVAANLLATENFARTFSQAAGLVPAKKDFLAQPPTDSFYPVFYNSALFARGWLDPGNQETNVIFGSMVEKVLANLLSPSEAIRDADSRLLLLLSRQSR